MVSVYGVQLAFYRGHRRSDSRGSLVMYDSASCSYAGALELKGASGAGAAAAAAGVTAAGVKQENWPYRGLTCGSTFQRLKESVDKAKQALADRGGYLSGAFSPPPRANPSTISPTTSITDASSSYKGGWSHATSPAPGQVVALSWKTNMVKLGKPDMRRCLKSNDRLLFADVNSSWMDERSQSVAG